MLFIPDSIFERRQQIMLDLDDGKIAPEEAYSGALEMDPDDYIALLALGHLRAEAGDKVRAEEFYWRAIQAQPCAWLPYLKLSVLLVDQEPLSKALTELACRKLLLDPEALEHLDEEDSGFVFPEGLEKFSEEEKLELLADALHRQRDLESVAVTARMHSLRLVHRLQEAEDLEAEEVDALVQEGESIVPLLVGVMRGCAQDVLPAEDTWAHANSIAILGEIGDTSAIPYLLEFGTLEDPELSGPSKWALDRIIEQHPSLAVRVFEELAPDLSGHQKLAMIDRLVRNSIIVPSRDLFARLFVNLDRLNTEERNAYFQVLMSSAIMALGEPALELSRTMLRQHGALLSRKTRRECEELIEEFTLTPIPPRPGAEPSPWTVYDLCAGNVDWDGEEKATEEDDELSPEPVRREFRPGRNDPCWCGSGKKYKKCHLDADEAVAHDTPKPRGKSLPAISGDLDDLRRQIGELMHQSMSKRETDIAMEEFYGTDLPDPKMGPALLVDWMIHDRIFPTFGRTIMAEFLHRHASSLNDRERQFVESSARSYLDLFEVQEVKENSGIEVKSFTSGETFFVHDINMSKVTARWDGLYGRVIDGERGREFTGAGIRVPRMDLAALWQWMEQDHRSTGISWPAYMKANWPRVRAQHTRMVEQYMESVQLTNTDGEELVESRAFYQVLNPDALRSALRGFSKIHEEEKGKLFVWLSAEEDGTVLGDIPIVGDRLILECNSKERLKRGKRMLSQLAGAALSFEKDEFVSQEEMKRSFKENPRAHPSKVEISPEMRRRVEREYMEEHYARWPDTKLPALNGKTPRQAVKNAAGKRKVAEILKQIENTEAHKRRAGEYAYDVSRLRAELGVKG